MSFTYTPGSSRPLHIIRSLIPDAREASYTFEDEEIEGFFVAESGDIRKATALALETIASDRALVQGVIKTMDLQVDGVKVAEILMKRAEKLRQQSDNDIPKASSAGYRITQVISTPGISFRLSDE